MMAAKQRTLRRKRIIQEDNHAVDSDNNDFEQMKSPVRKLSKEAGQASVSSPRFCSPIATPTAKRVTSPGFGDISLSDSSDKLSQEPTPSKWNDLVPDFNSQPEGVHCEVLWDCASPDAARHLRRLPKNDNTVQELVKLFKEPPVDKQRRSPPIQLQVLRAAFRRQLRKQQRPPKNNEKKKQKKLEEAKRTEQENRQRAKELCGEMLAAVRRREQMEAEQKQECKNETTSDVTAETVNTSDDDGGGSGCGGDGGGGSSSVDDDDCWEDDELFQDNSFIIAATQNPYQFITANKSKTSTPLRSGNSIHRPEVCQTKQCNECLNGCEISVSDSQNSGIIPPTYVPIHVKLDPKQPGTGGCRTPTKASTGTQRVFSKNLVSKFDSATNLEDGCTVQKDATDLTTVKCTQDKFKYQLSSTSQLGDALNSNQTSADKPVIGQKKLVDKWKKPSGAMICAGADQEKRAPVQRFNSDGMFSESLLRLTENHEKFYSQTIEEFPTQAPPALCAPSLLSSAKASDSHDDDFSDDLDPTILAAIAEYDSFSESPCKRVSAETTKPIPKSCDKVKRGYCDRKQPGLQLTATSSKTESNILCVGNKRNFRFKPTLCSSPRASSDNGSTNCTIKQSSCSNNGATNCTIKQSSCSNNGTTNCTIKQSSCSNNRPTNCTIKQSSYSNNEATNGRIKQSSCSNNGATNDRTKQFSCSNNGATNGRIKQSTPVFSGSTHSSRAQPEMRKDVLYPVCDQNYQENARPLCTLATGNTITKNPGSSMQFRPKVSCTTRTSSSKNDEKAANTTVDTVSASHLKQISDDDLLDDDPLYESEIMAILDEVESQASQQTAAQTVNSATVISSQPKCSQEQIERKRQAALKKLRSKGRRK